MPVIQIQFDAWSYSSSLNMPHRFDEAGRYGFLSIFCNDIIPLVDSFPIKSRPALVIREAVDTGWLLFTCALWRHQMETFSALLAICAGNSPFPGEFPKQRPVTRSFDVFLDLRPKKRFSKHCWGWWFETLSCPLWYHCNVSINFATMCECKKNRKIWRHSTRT